MADHDRLNLGNLWRRLALSPQVANWLLTSLQQRLVKTGGRLVKHARYYSSNLISVAPHHAVYLYQQEQANERSQFGGRGRGNSNQASNVCLTASDIGRNLPEWGLITDTFIDV